MNEACNDTAARVKQMLFGFLCRFVWRTKLGKYFFVRPVFLCQKGIGISTTVTFVVEASAF
jgi:hypothetical protein